MRSLTRVAVKKYRAAGMRIIGMSPGTAATQMQMQIRTFGIHPVSLLGWAAHIPPQWVAHAVADLATPQADAHLGTGFSLKAVAELADAGLKVCA